MNWAAVAFLATVTCGILSAGAEESVDLLVVGGSVDNVRVAAEAARKGEKVLLATTWPYLGDDMAATLELGFGGGVPDDPLLRRMWTSSSDLAPFDYTPDRRSDGIRHIYHNDRLDRLSEPGRPPSPADSVWYTGDVSFKCRLRGAARVSTVEVLVLTTRKMADDGVTAEQANDPSRNTLAATAAVGGTVVGGPADGRSLVFRSRGRVFTVRGDYYRGDADAVSFVADVDEEIGGANLVVRQDSAARRRTHGRWCVVHHAEPGAQGVSQCGRNAGRGGARQQIGAPRGPRAPRRRRSGRSRLCVDWRSEVLARRRRGGENASSRRRFGNAARREVSDSKHVHHGNRMALFVFDAAWRRYVS